MKTRSRHSWPASLAVTVLLTVVVAGCAVGPDFNSPEAPRTDRYGREPAPAATASTDSKYGQSQALEIGKQLPTQWWTAFGSKQLDDLVLQSFSNSPTVTAAQASLRQAHENYLAERASFLPFLDLAASGTRQKINSANFGDPAGGVFIYNLFNTSLNLTYGIDLFGGTRRAVEQQAALEQYQKAELLSTYQTLAANVTATGLRAAGYIILVQTQQKIVEEEEDLLKVTETRYKLGAIAYSDVLTARANVATERAAILPLQLDIEQAQDQMAVYIGKLPSEYQPEEVDFSAFMLPQEIPLSIPSELTHRRPDILAAEAQLHAASANVGVATANMFPQLSITASIGTEASVLHQLFNSSIWSLGASVAQPVLHAGQLNARRRAAIAAYDESAANYRQTVLTAFQNVADSLNVLTTDAETQKVDQEAFQDSDEALHIVEQQYRLGSASFLDLLTAQLQQSRARTNVVQASLQRFVDSVTLFQALGGGSWDASMTLSATDQPAADSH